MTSPSPKHKPEKLQLIGKGLTKFPAEKIKENVQELILNNNQISSFQGMISLPSLTKLSLDNNNISSFEYATIQPSLTEISFLNNPISNWKYFKVMCILAFGNTLFLNGSKSNLGDSGKPGLKSTPRLSKEEQAFFKVLESNQNGFNILHQYITEGWIIMSLNPVRLLQPETRERFTYYLTQNDQQELNP